MLCYDGCDILRRITWFLFPQTDQRLLLFVRCQVHCKNKASSIVWAKFPTYVELWEFVQPSKSDFRLDSAIVAIIT